MNGIRRPECRLVRFIQHQIIVVVLIVFIKETGCFTAVVLELEWSFILWLSMLRFLSYFNWFDFIFKLVTAVVNS